MSLKTIFLMLLAASTVLAQAPSSPKPLTKQNIHELLKNDVPSERLAELVEKYADRSMDFADACLVYMSEQTRDCKVVTIDRADFAVYRRHGRETIPLLLPV